jgi:hypothetical protein
MRIFWFKDEAFTDALIPVRAITFRYAFTARKKPSPTVSNTAINWGSTSRWKPSNSTAGKGLSELTN